MEFFVVLFIAFVVIMIVASTIVFGIVFFRVSRFSGKVFEQAERELERKATAARETPASCPYCGSSLESGDQCSNCGAPPR